MLKSSKQTQISAFSLLLFLDALASLESVMTVMMGLQFFCEISDQRLSNLRPQTSRLRAE